MALLAQLKSQAIAGVAPPQVQEAMVREVWATVAAHHAAATSARKMMQTIFLAPVGWLMLAPLFGMRLLGFLPGLRHLTIKYTVTNKRVMVRQGMKPVPLHEIPLNEVGDVRIVSDANSEFYLASNLEILRKDGSIAFTMKGVPEPESVRLAILQSRDAWGPLLQKPLAA